MLNPALRLPLWAKNNANVSQCVDKNSQLQDNNKISSSLTHKWYYLSRELVTTLLEVTLHHFHRFLLFSFYYHPRAVEHSSRVEWNHSTFLKLFYFFSVFLRSLTNARNWTPEENGKLRSPQNHTPTPSWFRLPVRFFPWVLLRGKIDSQLKVKFISTHPRHNKFATNHLHISLHSCCDGELMWIQCNALYVRHQIILGAWIRTLVKIKPEELKSRI